MTDYLTLHTNFSHMMALQYRFIKITYSLNIQKNHVCTHICVVSCASQTQPNLTFQNQINMQTVIPALLIPMNLYLMKIHHKNLLHNQLHPITVLQLLPQMTAHLSNCLTTHLSKKIKTPQTASLLTDHDTHIRINQIYFLLQ